MCVTKQSWQNDVGVVFDCASMFSGGMPKLNDGTADWKAVAESVRDTLSSLHRAQLSFLSEFTVTSRGIPAKPPLRRMRTTQTPLPSGRRTLEGFTGGV